MKKIFTTISIVLLATVAFHVNAELWLIGGFTPSGWVTNSGLEFTQVDDDNYTLEIYLTATRRPVNSIIASRRSWHRPLTTGMPSDPIVLAGISR